MGHTSTCRLDVDCLVLGGGITGAGVARDASLRGLRTALVDSNDFASGTSHLTSKLIHGGLRYLDQGKIRLVAEGIMERDRLLNRIAPNLVHPLRFILPYERAKLPKWLFTVVGIQSYGFIELYRNGRGCKPLFAPQLRRACPSLIHHPFGVSYWDAQTNDARLVLATLRTAEQLGAQLFNYTTIEAASFHDGRWSITFSNPGGAMEVHARSVVNATGPWSPRTAEALGLPTTDLIWVKGSHLLLRRPHDFGHDAVIIRSTRDGRPLWIIPWQTRLIVGSTESRYEGDLRDVRPDADEIEDLFGSFIHYFPTSGVTRSDIRSAYAGVRPIVHQAAGDENRLSRKYELLVDEHRKVITINGGKLTTFRRMAEKTIDLVDRLLGRRQPDAKLRRRLRGERLWPGRSLAELAALESELAARLNGSPAAGSILHHWVWNYGPDARQILDRVLEHPADGQPLFEGLPYSTAELIYLAKAERACRLLDLVKRRTSIYFLADGAGLDSLEAVLPRIARALEWDEARCDAELASVAREFGADCRAIPAARESLRVSERPLGQVVATR